MWWGCTYVFPYPIKMRNWVEMILLFFELVVVRTRSRTQFSKWIVQKHSSIFRTCFGWSNNLILHFWHLIILTMFLDKLRTIFLMQQIIIFKKRRIVIFFFNFFSSIVISVTLYFSVHQFIFLCILFVCIFVLKRYNFFGPRQIKQWQ